MEPDICFHCDSSNFYTHTCTVQYSIHGRKLRLKFLKILNFHTLLSTNSKTFSANTKPPTRINTKQSRTISIRTQYFRVNQSSPLRTLSINY
jgi:hypothetical protein